VEAYLKRVGSFQEQRKQHDQSWGHVAEALEVDFDVDKDLS